MQNKTRLPHRFDSFFVSAGYKHREIAIGAKKKQKQGTFTTKKAKEKLKHIPFLLFSFLKFYEQKEKKYYL